MLHEEDARRLALGVLGQAYLDLKHVYTGVLRQQDNCVCPTNPRIKTYTGIMNAKHTFPLTTKSERDLLRFWLNSDGLLETYCELAGIDGIQEDIRQMIKTCVDYEVKCLPCLIKHRRESRRVGKWCSATNRTANTASREAAPPV